MNLGTLSIVLKRMGRKADEMGSGRSARSSRWSDDPLTERGTSRVQGEGAQSHRLRGQATPANAREL